jgi:hypothetical protein
MDKQDELIIANLVLPLVKDLVLPKINSVISKFSNNKINSQQIECRFEEYLTQRYERFLIIDTLVFPNQQTLFDVIYEPLTVTDKKKHEKGNEIIIDCYPKEFIPKFCRVIIEDTAGMGKSTISKKLFQSIIRQNVGIPILIELRQINLKNKILKEIQRQLSPIGKSISQDVILKIINEGDFIFLFDGFDEVPNINKDFVIKELHEFIEKADNNYFLITSRVEDSLSSFGDFKKFRIRDLNKEEAYSLINRYDNYNYKPIAEELIEQLEKNESESLKEYLTNPLLVSLLYKSFDYKKDIPVKKSQFYRQVYDALFETHDLSKEGYLKREKYSKLHTDDFERVLRYIGYFTAIENIIEYEKDFIINIIDKSKKHLPDLKFKSSDFLKDLLKTVPLFKQEGNCYRWSHKSLQDYFAAKFIWIDAKDNQAQILRKIFELKNNNRFYNMLDIYYELDPITFDSTITFWLLTDFCKYANDNINKFKDVSTIHQKTRIENTYAGIHTLLIRKAGPSLKEGLFKKIHDYNSKIIPIEFECCRLTYHYFKESKLMVDNYHFYKNNIEAILALVSKKKPSLISFKDSLHDHKELLILKENEAYVVNMDIDNEINNKEIFELINEMTQSGYTLSYDNAFKELKRIEASIQTENDFVNW